MALEKVTYLSIVGGDITQEYPQTFDQACLAIGANFVAGFRVEREEKVIEGKAKTTVSVYGSNDVLFGVYEFTGRL